MNCETFQANIDRYLEGLLPENERATFKLHEKECLSCAKRLNDRLWDRVGDPNDIKVCTLRGPEND